MTPRVDLRGSDSLLMPSAFMRRLLRFLTLTGIAVSAVRCTEAPSAPETSLPHARIELSPTFSPSAARAYSLLAQAGVEVTSVHVHLVAPDGSVHDTTVAFPVGV